MKKFNLPIRQRWSDRSLPACAGVATLVAIFTLCVSGCGTKTIYPVHGQIVDADGKPITEMKGGAVEFDCVDAKSSANSSIDEAGKFRLTTQSPGDGAHLGKHRVAITRPYIGPEQPVPHVIDPKYEKFETSGLEVVVEPKDNAITLKVVRVKK